MLFTPTISHIQCHRVTEVRIEVTRMNWLVNQSWYCRSFVLFSLSLSLFDHLICHHIFYGQILKFGIFQIWSTLTMCKKNTAGEDWSVPSAHIEFFFHILAYWAPRKISFSTFWVPIGHPKLPKSTCDILVTGYPCRYLELSTSSREQTNQHFQNISEFQYFCYDVNI